MGIAGSRGADTCCRHAAFFRPLLLVLPFLMIAETRAQTLPATTRSTTPTTIRPATRVATRPTATRPVGISDLSLDELMNLEVTTVSKRAERLDQAASAVQVVTGEDIRRSGALTLPEALRLAPNLQVAQINAHDFAITSRGFNGASAGSGAFSNKLLVMIDGRSVYTPLFGG